MATDRTILRAFNDSNLTSRMLLPDNFPTNNINELPVDYRFLFYDFIILRLVITIET